VDLTLLRKPSACLPIAMSVAALVLVVGCLALYGIPRTGGDEGAVAHTWQLLMVCQLPLSGYFAAKWLRRAPRQAVLVLALQAAAGVAALAPVYLLHL
jgi:steroid 5-alpha reductase family enzyme